MAAPRRRGWLILCEREDVRGCALLFWILTMLLQGVFISSWIHEVVSRSQSPNHDGRKSYKPRD